MSRAYTRHLWPAPPVARPRHESRRARDTVRRRGRALRPCRRSPSACSQGSPLGDQAGCRRALSCPAWFRGDKSRTTSTTTPSSPRISAARRNPGASWRISNVAPTAAATSISTWRPRSNALGSGVNRSRSSVVRVEGALAFEEGAQYCELQRRQRGVRRGDHRHASHRSRTARTRVAAPIVDQADRAWRQPPRA